MVMTASTVISTTGGAKGTERWMPKEAYDADGGAFTKEADIWAFGMTAYVSQLV